MRALSLILGLLIACCVADSASANEGTEVRVEVQVFVPQLQKLEIEQVVWNLPSPTAADYLAGYLKVPTPFRLRLYSNTPWELSVKAEQDDIAFLQDGPIPLQWSLDKRNFSFISNNWTPITSGEGPAPGRRVELSYRMMLNWQDCIAALLSWRWL